MAKQPKLNNIEDIRQFFSENKRPIYFISPTNFNLIGLDEWVQQFKYVNYIDCFDQQHPNLIRPKTKSPIRLESSEAINHYMMQHKDVLDAMKKHQNQSNSSEKPLAVFLFFNEETEALCEDIGLTCAMNSFELVTAIDDKIETTMIGNEAGVSSVPNVLSNVNDYHHLKTLASDNKLGDRLVIQSAFGDSGKTTYFVHSQETFDQYADEITAEKTVKIMKEIRCAGTAIEACITQNGTLVGPLMTECIGFDTLTPYKGGWCGNELRSDAFPEAVKKQAMEMTERLGNALKDRGFKGYFEVDYLIDLDTNDVYLGEINPRITGISAMTNLSEACQATLPLFMFHLLEFMDITYSMDVKKYNQYMLNQGASQPWAQLIIKYVPEDLKIITEMPRTGVYHFEKNELHYQSMATSRKAAQTEHHGFFLRISDIDDYAYEGADLGILFVRHDVMTNGKLTEKARAWINGINGLVQMRELSQEEQLLVARYQNPGQLKAF